MCNLIRGNLVECASKLAIKAKGIDEPTVTSTCSFRKFQMQKKMPTACSYWLELIEQDNYLESNIINPILEESNAISHLFALGDQENWSERLLK